MKNKKNFNFKDMFLLVVVIVVISVTIVPTLTANRKKHLYSHEIQKSFNLAFQACQISLSNNDTHDIYETDLMKSLLDGTFADTGRRYFQGTVITKNPRVKYKSVSGRGYGNSSWYWNYAVDLMPGTIYLGAAQSENSPYALLVGIDTNGMEKSPNKVGSDLFAFNLTKTCRLVPVASDGCKSDNFHDSMYGCFQKVIEDGWEVKYDAAKK